MRFRLLHCIPLTALLALSVRGALAQESPGNPLDGLATLKSYRSERASSTDPNWQSGNGDNRQIAPGATLVLADLKGPGEIAHIWNTIADSERFYSRLLVLRMYWDGEKDPSVECPIGDFFGVGHGMDVPFDSLPVRVTSDGRGRNCYWPMPFRRSALITVTNEGTRPVDAFYYYIDWRKLPRLAGNVAYFHADYRQEFPEVSGKNYLIADIQGRGHYVGTVYSILQRTPGWWGEGNDYFYVDGESVPSLKGTGTEDYFCDGWGLRQQSGPYYGAPLVEGTDAFDRTTAYRWHIPDPIAFTKSLRVEIQHMGAVWNPDGTFKSGFGERADDLSSVAFWYQIEPHKPFPPMPVGYARLPFDYRNMVLGPSLMPAAKASAGSIERQELYGEVGGAQLWWRPTTPGERLTLPLRVSKAGDYDILFLCTYAPDYGTYQFELDGKPLGDPVDFYGPDIDEHERVFPAGFLSAGEHVLRVLGKGKDDRSTGYLFGLNGYLLTPQ